MKQITLRTLVRTVNGKGTLWEHRFAMLVEKGSTLGLETLTIVPQGDYAPLYEYESEHRDGEPFEFQHFLDLKKAERHLQHA